VAAWFVTAQESRYLIYCYAIAAVFAVLGWQYVGRLSSRYGSILAVVAVACSVLYGLEMFVSVRASDAQAVLSSSFEAKRRLAETPFIESFDYLNAESSVSKVLILDPYVAAYFSDKPYLKPLGRWGEQTVPDATDVSSNCATSAADFSCLAKRDKLNGRVEAPARRTRAEPKTGDSSTLPRRTSKRLATPGTRPTIQKPKDL
jgi:hypothetical protein